ncbi:hypothetical protein GF337_08185 [candidate division KSB1 bacterium]|nr:hypothetical protein [candidate division KSB1 bacterium]
MKKAIHLFLILFLSYSLLMAGAVIVDFKAEPGKNKVVLKWSTLSESNCKEFEIQRGLDKTNFQKIGAVDAQGNSADKKEYTYEDKTVFKATSNTFYYRIKIINKDASESMFDEVVVVTPSVSGVQHTWGSIKALFR